MPIRPTASFPSSVWDGFTTGNPDRLDGLSQVDPDWNDYERIAAEIIAIENNVGGASVTNITSDTTLVFMSQTVLVDASAGAVEVTLPTPTSALSMPIYIKKIDSSPNSVVITPETGTIDSAAEQIIVSQNNTMAVIADGTNWYIV